MARKRTALGVCSKFAAAHSYAGAKRKSFMKRCIRELAAQKRAGLGYVPPRAGSPQYVWKVGKRKGR